ncbi:MAG: MBL fold metallo-hydrolase [Deltaproteobacteria bacterium]|jgi:glyoxylase-like metal-dependent hydrolase (beta-lactamase superfamily II)|nr:MBL fold metallo-hydrolase [Deltaproteobacteria bacterium]
MLRWKVGDVSIACVVEFEPVMSGEGLFPMSTSEARERHAAWLRPHFMDDEGNLLMSIHAFLLESQGRRIVVDTCLGNGRQLPFEGMSDLSGPFLEDIAAAGHPREKVDIVICTHLHFDHVGWNTMRVGDRWVPTFPNARYLFAKKEWEDFQKPSYPEDEGIMHDCMLPIFDEGLADLVSAEHRITDEVWLEPTPGHTPGHVSVRIASRGEEAVITGDIVHHPVQLAEPTWHGVYDADVEQAIATRRDFCERYADRPVLVFGTHFRTPTAGRLVSAGEAWRLDLA